MHSAHFAYDQVTLTQVSYYGCSTCDQQIDDSCVFISSDIGHDAPFVAECQMLYNKEMEGIEIGNLSLFQ